MNNETQEKVRKFWGSASNTHASASDGAKAKIMTYIRTGAPRKVDGSTTYSSITPDTGGQPPMVIGGNMLAGDVNNSWVPTEDDEYNLGTITGGTGSASFRWKELFLNPTGAGSADNDLQIKTDGQVIKITSSARYKENIRGLEVDTNKLYDLKPSTFNHKTTPEKIDFGLIAEEVEESVPELVTYNKEGQVESVKYSLLSVLLLQELKKLRQEIDDLKNEAKE